MKRRFRFIVSMPRLADGVAAWQSALRRIEDRGYSTIAISDHFTQGWAMEPLVTLAAAAAETERVRLLTLVLGNDYRHPVLVHKAAATIDVISGGRLELGLGAGWMRAEYEAAGLAYDEPKIRRDALPDREARWPTEAGAEAAPSDRGGGRWAADAGAGRSGRGHRGRVREPREGVA